MPRRQASAPAFDPDRMVSPGEIARFWRVDVNVIYRDIRKGALLAYKLPGGTLRVPLSEGRRYGRPDGA